LRRNQAERLEATLVDPSADASGVLRARAGDTLARLGDPRFRADAWHLPDEPLLGFVEVPAGPFLMGSDKGQDPEAYDDELPQHTVDLPAYYIARYPVTTAQFRIFVDESGHRPADEGSLRGADNHPVVWVTWHDARAYCDWLAGRLRAWEGTPEPLAGLLRHEGWQVRLPTEAEWEKAARGTDGRVFPWGDEPDSGWANYADTGVGATSAVGCFPGGDSPYGVQDMSGNVDEWCHSLYAPYPYDLRDGREALEAKGPRVLRGGAFYDDLGLVRCAYRFWFDPDSRFVGIGFRVVLAPGFL
jgi:formylglycine-generating enzyme required for sulfatase activity